MINMNRAETVAAYMQAQRDFAEGLICQADLDKAAKLVEQLPEEPLDADTLQAILSVGVPAPEGYEAEFEDLAQEIGPADAAAVVAAWRSDDERR